MMAARMCGYCGYLPCKCKIGECTKCGVRLNLDAIGEPLFDWNNRHAKVTGCKGMVIDPRIVNEMEEDLKSKLDAIIKMKKESKN